MAVMPPLGELIEIPDSEEEEAPPGAALGSNPSSNGVNNAQPGSTPSSGPSCGRSPLMQQEQTGQARPPPPASAARQLYQQGFYVDEAANTARREQLRRTGKALAVPEKEEEEQGDPGQREPTDEDIAQLQEQLLSNPGLAVQLSGRQGQGSSNPQHLWRLRVYQALLQQQEQLLLRQPEEAGVADSQAEKEDKEQEEAAAAAPPAKRRRTLPSPADAAVGADGAGSSRQQAPDRRRQQQQQQQLEGDEHMSDALDEQQQQPPRQPAPRPPRQPRQQQQRINAAAAGGPPANRTERDQHRALRAKLSQLQARAARNHEELIDSSSGDLASYLLKLQDLGEQATRPREAAQHAEVLADFAKGAVDMIHSFNSERRGRNPAQLVSALRLRFARDGAAALGDGPAPIRWDQLSAAAGVAALFRTAPGVSSMLGALAGEARVRKQALRQRRAPPEPEVRPVVGQAALQQDHGLRQETERVVEAMRRVLQQQGSCRLVQLVLARDSFAHTVENMFALSLLCKDRYVALEEDRERGLIVKHITAECRRELERSDAAATAAAAQQASGGGGGVSHQLMMQLDMGVWQDMQAVVPRGSELMPPGRAHATPDKRA